MDRQRGLLGGNWSVEIGGVDDQIPPTIANDAYVAQYFVAAIGDRHRHGRGRFRPAAGRCCGITRHVRTRYCALTIRIAVTRQTDFSADGVSDISKAVTLVVNANVIGQQMWPNDILRVPEGIADMRVPGNGDYNLVDVSDVTASRVDVVQREFYRQPEEVRHDDVTNLNHARGILDADICDRRLMHRRSFKFR